MSITKIEEFNVPMPWGHIAVKAWGDEKNEAVLVIHGRLDNAGAFDRLIPFLPKSFYYICIDLPGHGKSSHFPPYLPLFSVNFILAYKVLAQYFKRQNYIILGHSYGGQIGLHFAQLYPNLVKKLILIDTVRFGITNVKEFKWHLLDIIQNHFQYLEKQESGKQPSYTYEEALNKLLNGRQGTPLSIEAAKALLQRSVKQKEDGRYVYVFDQRMKNFINPLHDYRYAVESLKEDPVTCPILIIFGQKSLSEEYMRPILQVLKTWSNVSIQYVDGFHDIHNNNPDVVGPLISKFLLHQMGKL